LLFNKAFKPVIRGTPGALSTLLTRVLVSISGGTPTP
jgi:hypothetical protein